MAENDIPVEAVFKEKVRHPSANNEWIVMRDYAPTNEPSKIYFTEETATVTAFNLTASSYNYLSTNQQWINNQDKINGNSVSIPNVKSELIGEQLTFIGTTTNSLTSTFTVKDILNTVSYSGTYADNGVSTNITDTETPSWNNNFITNNLTTNLSFETQVKSNDILVVPNKVNDQIKLAAYSILDSSATDATGQKIISFNYIPNTDNNKTILNIIKDTNPYIPITEMLESFGTKINNLTLSNGYIASINSGDYDMEIDPETGQPDLTKIVGIYGNGIGFNRYEIEDSELLGKGFNYQWLAANGNLGKNYILQYDRSSGKILNMYEVEISIYDNNNRMLELKYKQNIGGNYSGVLNSGWTGGIFTDYERYKLANNYIFNPNSTNIIKDFKTIEDLEEELKTNNPPAADETINDELTSIPRTDTNKILENSNIQIQLWTNNNIFANTTWTSTSVSSEPYIWNYNNNNVMQFNINSDNDIVFKIIKDSENTLGDLFDSIIEKEYNTAIEDININFYLASITGSVNYTLSIENVCKIQNIWTSNNIYTIDTYAHFWDAIKINPTEQSATEIGLYYTNDTATHNSYIRYYTSPSQLNTSNTFTGKIWFLLLDTPLIKYIGQVGETNTDNIFLLKKNNLLIHEKFLRIIEKPYTTLLINIQIPEGGISEDQQYQNIKYTLHQYAHTIRYYGSDNELLNIGDEWTPVYIKDGQFFPCNNLVDAIVSNTNPMSDNETYNNYANIWIDTVNNT